MEELHNSGEFLINSHTFNSDCQISQVKNFFLQWNQPKINYDGFDYKFRYTTFKKASFSMS